MNSSLHIPFYNVDRFYNLNSEKILFLSQQVFSSGKVLEGDFIKEFEQKLAKRCNRKFAVTVNSCTDALFFSLLSMGIKPGDEVLVPSFSFIASASPIIRIGAKPVFVDTDLNGNIDLAKAELALTTKTKAIIAVHLHGRMINPVILKSFSEKHQIPIIEDAAQALGSSYNNIFAGSIGTCSCFSFDPSKVVSAMGTGGAVLTDNESIYQNLISIRAQGKENKSNFSNQVGYNSRISTLQGAILSFQMDLLDQNISKRNQIALQYSQQLSLHPEIRLIKHNSENQIWNYHKFPLFIVKRDDLKNHLNEKNIETGIHYPTTLVEHPLFNSQKIQFPVAEELSKTTLSLPIYPELTANEILYICESINTFLKR